jgi:hypothetical protein
MKHTFLTGALLLLLLVCLCACEGEPTLTAYQTRPLHLLVAFETEGTPFEAEVTLSAGGEGRDLTLTYTAPAEVAGLTITRTDGTCTARQGEMTIPMGTLAAALEPLTLFCIPSGARVTGIEKEDETRTATLTWGSAVYTLRFEGASDIPTFLCRTEGGTTLALTVKEILS